jgi:hypothetical protein
MVLTYPGIPYIILDPVNDKLKSPLLLLSISGQLETLAQTRSLRSHRLGDGSLSIRSKAKSGNSLDGGPSFRIVFGDTRRIRRVIHSMGFEESGIQEDGQAQHQVAGR